MAQFHITFQVQGIGAIELPVTPLDDLIVLVNGLEVKTFRFSVQNTLALPVTLNIAASQTGTSAGQIVVTFDVNPVTIESGLSAIVTATITPTQPLLEGTLIGVDVVGTQSV